MWVLKTCQNKLLFIHGRILNSPFWACVHARTSFPVRNENVCVGRNKQCRFLQSLKRNSVVRSAERNKQCHLDCNSAVGGFMSLLRVLVLLCRALTPPSHSLPGSREIVQDFPYHQVHQERTDVTGT